MSFCAFIYLNVLWVFTEDGTFCGILITPSVSFYVFNVHLAFCEVGHGFGGLDACCSSTYGGILGCEGGFLCCGRVLTWWIPVKRGLSY